MLLGVVGLALRRRMGAPSAEVVALLTTIPDALGDAALLLDRGGRIVAANAEAVRLAGCAPGQLSGTPGATLLGEDLAVLRRGLDRGPASGTVTLRAFDGPRRARAALARVSSRPVRELLVLRPEVVLARPPPIPPATPPPAPPSRTEARADLAAVAAGLRDPIARAVTAASMLRLFAPGAPRVDAELTRIEAALQDLERRLGALAAAGAGGAGRPRALDLAALVGELLDGLGARADVRLRRALAPARALVDEGRIRTALREVLRAASDALPAGAELSVAVVARAAVVRVEIESSAASAASAEAAAVAARALLGPEGVRVELEIVPGRGPRCTVVLPAARAPAIEPA